MSNSRTAQERIEVPRALAGYMQFMWAGLVKQSQTGGIVPSQRFLINKMISPIPENYRGQIIELGAGNGAITLRMAARCPQARILACEINPVLAQYNRCNLNNAGINGHVNVVCDSAENVLQELSRHRRQRIDYVISGIPLANLSKQQSDLLLDRISGAVDPGGMYIQFQHSLMHRKSIRARFAQLRTIPVALNFPPAVIYFARR